MPALLSQRYEIGIEAGVDEAGRGCLAGPVVAAAVILPKNYQNEGLNDSKQLTKTVRNSLRKVIEKDAISWAIGIASPQEIDAINILKASFLAMQRAITAMSVMPDLLLIDGNRFKTNLSIPYECIIKGDGKIMSIAAASILAKTYRDDYMEALSQEFPQYDWKNNAGYPTAKHCDAIAKYGITIHHRKTFRLKKWDKKLQELF